MDRHSKPQATLTQEIDVEEIARELLAQRRIPTATYRIQFNQRFTFHDALKIVSYLADLGISDCYTSPLFTPRPGSTHGYDVFDYSRINPELGGEEAFLAFADALRKRHMGLVLDMVPNHMGVGSGNPWWMDVLENGPSSPYATFFDIDWQPVKPELANKVLLPILEDQYGVVLESGKFQLMLQDGAFFIAYYDLKLPLGPRTYSHVLSHALANLETTLDDTHSDLQEYRSILTALSYLPPRTEQDSERLAERFREKEVIKRRLGALYQSSAPVRKAVDATIETFNGVPGDPRSFDLLHELIDAQPYRPAFWRVAAEEINYRRFFDINDLAAIRVELPEVFEETHQLVMRLLGSGHIIGLRIDHPDGLWDPPAYFRQLQERYLIEQIRTRYTVEDDDELTQAVAAWASAYQDRATEEQTGWPLYVVAEKILSEREPLPPDWAVAGTTGYDFLNAVNGIFIARTSERVFDAIYRRFLAPDDPASVTSFTQLVYDSKQLIMENSLASEIRSLIHQLERINEKNRRYRDFTLQGLTDAINAVVASMSIYRTYITDPERVSQRDQQYIEAAVRVARRRHRRMVGSLFNFIRDTLLLRNLHEFRKEDRAAVLNLMMRFQQITGPVMAKSVEDTAFYNYNRLVSLNEVGGAPDEFGMSVADFHRHNSERQQNWPHAILATSTHDTKRSEDVRARINLLSEIPEEWETAVTRWSEMNAAHKRELDDDLAPSRNDEYLLYQTLLGAWPLEVMNEDTGTRNGKQPHHTSLKVDSTFRERIAAYMQKATKEAKANTSWINPDEEYDEAVQHFVAAVLANGNNEFVRDFMPLQRRVAFYGLFNSLAQTLIKLTAPGVPDIYQGTELWDFSLVDPDNRRPVDYRLRKRMLAELNRRVAEAEEDRTALARELLEHMPDGRIKLYLISQTLAFRRRSQQLFTEGDYQPLEASGARRNHICAFARTLEEQAVLVVAPRRVVGLTGGIERPPVGADIWGNTWLVLPNAAAGDRYRDVLSGVTLTVAAEDETAGLLLADVFAHLPVALLERL